MLSIAYELLLSIHKYFVVDLNASKFNFELFKFVEPKICEANSHYMTYVENYLNKILL